MQLYVHKKYIICVPFPQELHPDLFLTFWHLISGADFVFLCCRRVWKSSRRDLESPMPSRQLCAGFREVLGCCWLSHTELQEILFSTFRGNLPSIWIPQLCFPFPRMPLVPAHPQNRAGFPFCPERFLRRKGGGGVSFSGKGSCSGRRYGNVCYSSFLL